MPDSFVLCYGSKTLIGFGVIENPTLGNFRSRDFTSNSMYMDTFIAPPLALLRPNMLCALASDPSAGLSHSLN